MAIENDLKTQDRTDEIRRIQLYAEQQAQLQAAQNLQIEQQAQALASDDKAPDKIAVTGQQQSDEAARERNAHDIQAQIQTQEVTKVNETQATSGQDLTDKAVDTANVQQDRGQAWDAFAADSNNTTVIPPSVDDLAADGGQDAQQRDQQTIAVADLINQMAIQSGKIGA